MRSKDGEGLFPANVLALSASLRSAAPPKGEPLAYRESYRVNCKASGFARGSPFGRAGALAPERASTLPRSAALSQKAALQMLLPSTTPPVKIAFGAARRPRQTQNKNNLSAEYVQSAAEHILNRPPPAGAHSPKRTTARHRGQSCTGRSCVKRRIALSCVGCIGELPG